MKSGGRLTVANKISRDNPRVGKKSMYGWEPRTNRKLSNSYKKYSLPKTKMFGF